MAVRVAVVGLGMMGATHFKAYQAIPEAQVVAVCDVSGRKRSGDWSGALGNIDTGAAGRTDLSAMRVYDDLAKLAADPDVDVVDVCVPTFQHADMAIQALEAGKHVFCEKPMARTSADAGRIIAAAQRAGRRLAVGHVLRFWPEYVMIKEMIDSGRHGRVRGARLGRFSARPLWSWDGWLLDERRSGGCPLDLHIHDADAVQWWFGPPRRVSAVGAEDDGGCMEHIVAAYHYDDGPATVVAEGGWDYPQSYPFRMEASVVFERAAVEFSTAATPTLRVFLPEAGAVETPDAPKHDGYTEELRYFIGCVAAGRAPERIAPEAARAAVALVEAEVEAARTGRTVTIDI
jgi:predicted dehydrogenase